MLVTLATVVVAVPNVFGAVTYDGNARAASVDALEARVSAGVEVQTLADLGTPLSDGCIRQDVDDAAALWEFAPLGTSVVVLS